jgi:two-component system chemotaxis response regulator CheB
LRAGHGWLAPGGRHLVVAGNAMGVRLEINDDAPENSCRPSVDPLFRSVAQVYGSSTLALIMTGMGRDGLAGCKAIRLQGGRILAQDEASSVVWGMPGSVVRAGLADLVLPLEALGGEVVRLVQAGRGKPAGAA